MAKRRGHSNVTDSGAPSYPPIHSRGQGFVSPMLSPVEEPNIGYEVDDSLLIDSAPNPCGFPIEINEKRGRR